MKVGERVYVGIAGKTGILLGWDGKGQHEVWLEGDPECVSRWFSSWDVESIEPHSWGEDPALDRRVEAGLEVMEELLDKKRPTSEAPEKEGEDD